MTVHQRLIVPLLLAAREGPCRVETGEDAAGGRGKDARADAELGTGSPVLPIILPTESSFD